MFFGCNITSVASGIRTYWGTDQTDSARLRSLMTRELSGGLNLVIDDASHLYEPTKRSFEILFPCVEPSGLYIIEDWAWSLWPEFQAKDHPWADQKPLSKLVFDLIEVAGSWSSGPKLIESIAVYQGFAAVERGNVKITDAENFTLEQCISRRPNTPTLNHSLHKLKRSLYRHILWRFR